MFDGEKDAVDVHGVLAAEFGERHGLHRAEDGDAGVGDHDVEAAVRAECRLDRGGPGGFVGDVLMEEHGIAAGRIDAGDDGLALGVIEVGDDDLGAFAGEGFRAGRADA